MGRAAWLVALTPDGAAVFEDGGKLDVDAVIYCTGYKYSYRFLENANLVSTGTFTADPVTILTSVHPLDRTVAEDMRVRPLFKHIFVPAVAPTLAFVGLPSRIPRFPTYELQARPFLLPASPSSTRSVQERLGL